LHQDRRGSFASFKEQPYMTDFAAIPERPPMDEAEPSPLKRAAPAAKPAPRAKQKAAAAPPPPIVPTGKQPFRMSYSGTTDRDYIAHRLTLGAR
jgi:hypothetical protein